jgi:hypothetical protein
MCEVRFELSHFFILFFDNYLIFGNYIFLIYLIYTSLLIQQPG